MATHETKVTAEPGKQELFITREFNAPRELVFQAFTDPKYLLKWTSPFGMKMRIESLEGPGGKWRFIHTDAKGNESVFFGVCHEAVPPERIIRTFEFEGLPEKGHVFLETTRLESLGKDRTRITVQSVFQSVQDRDGMVQSGMEMGVKDCHENLDTLLASLQQS